MDSKEILSMEIERLANVLERSNSFWRAFVRGLMLGVGSAIGASVVAAIVIGILTRIKESLPFP